MKTADEVREPEIIDVIEEFDYSTQSESYNKSYKAWRSDKSNPYAYNLKMNSKESVFIESKGFVDESAASVEQKFIGKTLYVIGVAVLFMVLVDNVIAKLAVMLMSIFGVNIHCMFINSTIYGGCLEIVTFLISVTTVKFVVPMIIAHFKFRMPLKVALPSRLRDSGELIGTLAATLIASAVLSIPSAYSEEASEIYSYFKAYNADVSVWGQGEFVVYTLFDIIIVSIFTEFLFRGEAFHVLRQYGDVFAVFVTALLSTLITQDLVTMPGEFLVAVIAAVGVLRSGTIFTAIAVRVIYKMYFMAVAIIQSSPTDYMFLTRNFFILGAFISGTAIMLLVYLNKKRRHMAAAKTRTQLSFSRKLMMLVKTVPIMAVIVTTLIEAIILITL